MGIGRALGKRLFEKASGKVGDALSHADVLGGKVRDRVVERLEELKRAKAAAVAPPLVPSKPPAPVVVKAVGLGDPEKPAQVFGRRSCPWTGRVLALLESQRVEHTYFELDSYGGEGVVVELKLETKQDTVPYVYVRGRFIGGYNALDEIHRLGQLEYLVLSNAEREKHPLHGRIEVAPRRHDGEHFPGA